MGRQGKDQVNGNVGDTAAAEGRDGGNDLSGVVGAMHPFKGGIGESLRTKGVAIYAGGNPVGDSQVVYVVGVGLNGDLGMTGDGDPFAHGGDDVGNYNSTQPRRSAAAEINRVQQRPIELVADGLQLLGDGSDVFVDRSSRPHRDGEIAVAAASSAEGYVDVEMADWHDRIYASVPGYRRRISPASEHSTRPIISSEVMATRHSARLRPVADGRSSDCTNPASIASQTFCSESGSSGTMDFSGGVERPSRLSASSGAAMTVAPSRRS